MLSLFLSVIGRGVLSVCITFTSLILCIPFLVFLLTLATIIRYLIPATTNNNKKSWSCYKTGLCTGRVSHTRFHPVRHSFSYPLFLMYLDLNEINALFGEKGQLWPLNLIMSFRESDHLKNNEGIEVDGTRKNLSQRIRTLVHTQTKGKCTIGKDQKINLLTHLCYFGYCFNPVSFYYIHSEDSTHIEVIVAEVSNTPWLEMKCYVLHPDSIDMHNVDNNESCSSVNYIFPKTFHVSPFMAMDYMYDWTFWTPLNSQVKVSASMIHPNKNNKVFNAYFNLTKTVPSPINLSYQMLRFPCYCVIIQIWIHVQAFWLFIKGVTFIPHPEEKETFVSNAIAMVMIPFFTMKDWFRKKYV